MERRRNMTEIAREAGVSLTAVSLFVNGKTAGRHLSAATCEKIAAVVCKYGFRPRISARAMRSGCTYLIGLYIPDPLNYSFWSDVVAGIEEAISSQGYHLLLNSDCGDGECSLRQLIGQGVDGCFVALAPERHREVALLQQVNRRIPVVGLNCILPGLPYVCNDQTAGGRLAARSFCENNFERIGIFARLGDRQKERITAFVDYCRENLIEPEFFDSANAVIDAVGRVDAVFCFRDYELLELYDAAGHRRVRIPQELSIIGYDGMDFLPLLTPPAVSVAQQKESLGKQAGNLLLELLKNPEAEFCREIRLSPALTVGGSVRKRSDSPG